MIGSWLQRTVLDSHFDHVGILLRFGNTINDLYVFESVGDGVRMVPWESARWYCGTYFDKIGYRKLHWDMKDDSLTELDRFRRNAMGREYALNLKKLLTNQSEVMS